VIWDLHLPSIFINNPLHLLPFYHHFNSYVIIMDFIKKAVSGSKGQQQPQAQGGAQQDYGDKAFSAASKKAGYNVDPNTSERITDAARGMYESATGKKVDPKYSN
jgi:hypothetical protein